MKTFEIIFKGLIILILIGIGVGSIYIINYKEKFDPIVSRQYDNNLNQAYQWECKSTAYHILRCKNWEAICYRFPQTNIQGNYTPATTTCYWINPPKVKHFKKPIIQRIK